ncbi:MAG: SDR family NAD(P)-dependent oxidoreductase [Acidobacteriaceae bacterium]
MEPQGYALVTGASYGIGEEFAWQLARRGWSLVLVARSQDRLANLREALVERYEEIDVRCVTMDLTASGAPVELFEKTQGANLEIGLLVNNAGFGAFGEFADIARERLRQMIDLNVAALVELTHLYVRPMRQRSSGAILNVASIAGFMPLPYNSVYAATKAFVISFSQALYEEASQYGVQVLVVNPGTTETNFFQVAGMNPADSPTQMQTSAQVVGEALRALDRGRRSITTGASNRLMMRLAHGVPSSWITTMIGKRMRRGQR